MSRPRRIGVLGGAFDPVHLGHLVVASEVHHALSLDEVLLVPTGRPWQKHDREVSAPEHRVRMTELAVAGDDRLSVSTVDVDRPGPTYSVDTVRDLRAQYGADAELVFVLGADALAGLPTWHEIDAFLADVTVVGCERPGHVAAVPPGLPADRFRLIETTLVEISASDVRRHVRAGAPIRYYVPDEVERYIAEHGLYKDVA